MKESRTPHSMRNSAFETTVKASATRHWSFKPVRGKRKKIILPGDAAWVKIP